MKKVLVAIWKVIMKSSEMNIKHNASANVVWMQETTKW